MKKSAKRLLSLSLAVILVFALSLTALAADPASTAPIGVQIGDKSVTFPDTVPEVQSGRTFLPVRAIFEALGAHVTYNGDSKTATAVKGDTTVQLGVNGKTIAVTNAGGTQTLQMDVASYINNNRMMVPARFAAQAFGCSVGWDPANRTVIILDVNSLLDNGNAKYTLMDKYLAYSKKYVQNCAVAGTFKLSAEITSEGKTIPIVTDGTINAVYDSKAVNLNVGLATDITKLITEIESAGELDNQTMLLLDMMKNVNFEYIINLSEGIIYLRCSLLSDMTGDDADTWYSINLNALLSGSATGTNLFSSAAVSSATSFRDYVAKLINMIPLSDVTTASALTSVLTMINSVFSDAAFVRNGDTYTSSKSFEKDGVSVSFSFALTIKNDAVTGYNMVLKAADSGIDMNISCSMDATDKADMSFNVSIPGTMKLVCTAALQYTQATKPAATAPEAGSAIVPFDPDAIA